MTAHPFNSLVCRTSLLSIILITSLPQLVHANRGVSLSRASKVQRYPRNLHRLYDGTWDTLKTLPFNSLPHSSDTEDQSPNSTGHIVTSDSASSDVEFQKRSGFTLLTIENRPSNLSPSISEVFGNLILRDGAYRTTRDVSFRLIGVYDFETGTLALVGDLLYQGVQSSLDILYDTFVNARSSSLDATPFNTTKDDFISALSTNFERRRNQLKSQGSGSSRSSLVAHSCPFSLSFAVTPGNYDDALPTDSDFAAPFGPTDSSNGGRVPIPGTSVFSGRGDSTISASTSQEEYVEMKGRFYCEACRTEVDITLTTLDTESLFGKAINYTLLVTVVAFIQVVVLIRQMEVTSTQAGARRVSLITVGLQAVADSYLCLGHLTMGIAVQTLFNAFATAAFFKFICFSIFLMRWMLLIWKARRPSGFTEGWEAMRRELSMLYSRFYGSLLLGIFLLYQLQNHVRFFVFGLYSFWVPQIILNIVEDHRRPLLPVYIAGTSLTRLAIPLYFWGCPHNFLHIEPHPETAAALVGWLLAQALVLLSQYKFGPRWFIPKEFLPEKYDYFRAVSVEDDDVVDLEASEGANDDRALVAGQSSEVRRECCICMESVAIHSRDRMVTPCNHFFHAACLERWLEVRLECALCRSPVPPP